MVLKGSSSEVTLKPSRPVFGLGPGLVCLAIYYSSPSSSIRLWTLDEDKDADCTTRVTRTWGTVLRPAPTSWVCSKLQSVRCLGSRWWVSKRRRVDTPEPV